MLGLSLGMAIAYPLAVMARTQMPDNTVVSVTEEPVVETAEVKTEIEIVQTKEVPKQTPAAPQVHNEKPYTVDEVVNLINVYSSIYNIAPVIPLKIAKCESGYRWDAKNKHSTASGVFQYIRGTWANTPEGKAGTSVFNAEANVKAAVRHIATHGTQPWNASIHCWQN